MITSRRTAVRRTAALLLLGLGAATGCGSATSQPAQSSAVSQAGSSTAAPGTQYTESQGTSRQSGITGQTVAVICEGASPGKQGCPRHPMIATVAVVRVPSKRRVASTRTDRTGHFRLELPPGTYQLLATSSDFLLWALPLTTRVLPHQMTRTTVNFGLRHPLPVTAGPSSS